MIHRRRRAVWLAGAISACLTLGLGPLANAPKAKADEFDAIVEPIINSITGSLGEVAAGSAAVPEPGSLGLDATESTAGVGLGSLSDVGSVAAASPFDAWLHGLEQDWLDSSFGQHVDSVLNDWLSQAAPAADAGNAAQPMSQNLLVNGNFDIADPSRSGFSGVTIPGWTETGTPTVIEYGTPRGYPNVLSFPFPKLTGYLGFPQEAPPGTPAGDDNFAGGGPVATSSISQTVDLTGAAGTPYELSADLGGQGLNSSYTTVQVSFLGADGHVLGTGSLKPVTVWDRLGITGFQEREITGTVPEGTTSAQVTTVFHDENQFLGNYNSAYAANESFTVGDPSLTAAPLTLPTSDVGHLNHVFLIYLENQGVKRVESLPTYAPFLNQLIKTEDFASNYYALSHPSNGNYIRIMGGSSFGIDYNVDADVINAPSLMQEMDQAGVSWAGYEQGIAPGTVITPQDSLSATPFGFFKYVYDNTPAYLQEHIFPQADLSSALQNPSTFPDFAWVKPDPPTSILDKIWNFIKGDLLNFPSGLKSEDQYLQQTVSTIEKSPTWTDPNEKDAIIITFDEDNNEPSLGVDHFNEGNNVPMIVIPNQAAVTDGGMQAGPFTTDTYYNQYDLMSTIADALRPAPGTLPPLTDNDKYAEPMNAFWK